LKRGGKKEPLRKGVLALLLRKGGESSERGKARSVAH